MAYNITAGEVRDRLRDVTSLTVTDATLTSVAYIPACESQVNIILSDNGYSFSTLSSDKQNLAKAAEIALVCRKVVSSIPINSFTTGPLSEKPVTAQDKATMVKIFQDEFNDLIDAMGCASFIVPWTCSTGDDYAPDGEDLTNVNWTDENETEISMWD